MFDVIKNILDVVKSLLGVSDQLKAAKRQRRADMGALFEKISDCLAAVSGEIRTGGTPHGRCQEMITYAEALPGLIQDEVGVAKAAELGMTLHSAYNVEQLAMMVCKTPDKEANLREIEEASGKFRALSHIVRVGL